MKVAILGASHRTDRYSYRALKMLEAAGHQVYPVHPQLEEIEGHRVYASLADLPADIELLTVYVNSKAVAELAEQIQALGLQGVIFNPGTETPSIYADLEKQGTRCVQACTLVMLSVGTFPGY